MEKYSPKRHIAVIENCIMSENGLKYLFLESGPDNYQFHFFKDYSAFEEVITGTPFRTVIFSMSGMRIQRINCLKNLHELACAYPQLQRLVLADNDKEAHLMSLLSPSHHHGVISKLLPLGQLHEQLLTLIHQDPHSTQYLMGREEPGQHHGLSPTEWEVLHYMTYGLSVVEIAHHLARNVKTVRAHKFNAMVKLGVHSDAGLLHAADILMNSCTHRVQLKRHDPYSGCCNLPA